VYSSLDGIPLSFTQEDEPTDEWWSMPYKLEAGKVYKLSFTGISPKDVFWKTATSSITEIPSSQLLPDFATKELNPAIIKLQKAALLVSGFVLSADEIRYFDSHKSDFDGLDFNKIELKHWLRLEAYTRLRNSLPQAKINILDFWQSPIPPSVLSEQIAALTFWKKESIEKLIDSQHFNLNVADFKNEINLLKLQHALSVADKIGMDINLLFDWAKPSSDFNTCRGIADSIEKSIRSQYKQTDWEQVVKPLSDKLRNNQKQALIAYLLQQPELIKFGNGAIDADGLFEFFLIDVQMEPCMETSRIKQAISSIQLFVQRCFLGLEEKYSKIKPNVLDRGRWEWMQRYRVWEANRKVFLYPENWIESNLRDNKSPFFQELESELLQKDINKQNVTDALKAYLYKVDEVANMEVIGLHIEDETYENKSVKKLHVFARTRNAPYFFYYRYFDMKEKNWYAWEKMQVDIPSYDVENETIAIKSNGCYLTPVVWQGRLLIFFPQILKKVRPNPNIGNKSFNQLAGASPNDNKQIEYWEIKMAWSEYRNGKWTQKQLSKESADTGYGLPEIETFVVVPNLEISKISIELNYGPDATSQWVKNFEFSGSQIRFIGDKRLFTPTMPKYFHKDNINNLLFKSLVLKNDVWQKIDIFHDDNITTSFITLHINKIDFFNASTQILLGKINTGQLETFFKYNTEGAMISQKADAFGAFDNDNNPTTPDIYHELKRPYSLYNWELFFHTPMLLADALSKAQQYEEAMKWYHFVFSPMAEGDNDKRFWQFTPFKDMDSKNILDNIFNNLKPNTADAAINEWRNHPFMPHLVARSRPVAYMKWVVMKYIDNILAWGDDLFRQDTIESINQATQLYILAGHILGPRPMLIPQKGKVRPQTYLNLLDRWDAFGNAMTEMEVSAPFGFQTTTSIGSVNEVVGTPNVFGFATNLYFCLPNNPKLMGYWDTVADRLFKIRHCQNIEGVVRKLPLFEPPIDPALLVKAAAQGLSIASVLNDLNTPMPNYRFYYLLQKALELCNEVKSMGNALLSAIEKKDNETLAALRAKHDRTINNLVMEVRKLQVEEAEKSLDTLQQNRLAAEHRMKYYLQLIGEDTGKVPSVDGDFSEIANAIEVPVDESGLKLIKYERDDMSEAEKAQNWQIASNSIEALSSIFHALPDFIPSAMPLGVGTQVKIGGSHFGHASNAASRILSIVSSVHSFKSSQAGKKGNFSRALQDRIFQANAAGYEIKQIDKQITAQQIRIQMANQEIINQQKLMDNAVEVEEFLKNKFSNEALYVWMQESLKMFYRQTYNLAYELAKKAEMTFRFERGISNSNFIQAGYWNVGYNGLLAGEQLYVGLKQMEAAYQETRCHDYEVTKHISLRQINPMALLQLKTTGKCEFSLPEVLFDMDFSGHYKRRIKSVSLSIPCIAGPYTSVNATLRLLENKFRNTAFVKNDNDYPETFEEEADSRFSRFIIPISAISTSSAQNDGGLFELNFKDERYLPFEGAGVISKWSLELPAFQQFDYNTISDIVVHLRYVATEGGELLKKAASHSVTNFISRVEELGQQEGLFSIIDLQHDLPTEWHKAIQNIVNEKTVLTIPDLQQFLPFYAKPFVKADKFETADTRFFPTDGIDGIVLAKTEGLKNKEVSITFKQNADKSLQKAYLIIRFNLKNQSGSNPT
jgi:Tc toxin complex TcA C-terminal TcB-binding domain/Neuraminidase-like domain